MIRSAASLRRVPVGRVPRLHRYYQRTPTSRRPSRRTSFSFAWRYHSVALFAPAAWAVPAGLDCCIAAVRAARSGGDVETSQVPGRPVPACPALRPRRNRSAPDHLGAADGAFHSCHSVGFRDEIRISWLNHAACKAACVRFADSVTTAHATLGSGWLANLGRTGLAPAGSQRRFPSCHNMPSPFTKLRLAQDKPVPYVDLPHGSRVVPVTPRATSSSYSSGPIPSSAPSTSALCSPNRGEYVAGGAEAWEKPPRSHRQVMRTGLRVRHGNHEPALPKLRTRVGVEFLE